MADLSVEAINFRLKEILKQVDDPDLPMDEILNLYEEAVKLGSKVGEAIEANIADADALAAADAAAAGEAAQDGAAAATDTAKAAAGE